MAVDPAMADSILSTFRNMAKQIQDKGLKTEAAQKVHEILEKMESLAREMNDLGEFSTKLAVDGIYTDFSNWYGKALSEGSGSGGDWTDEQLLAESIKAYENSLSQLKADPNSAHIVSHVEKIVHLGKSGISYPVFLKTCEENGVFAGLDSPHAKPVIEYQIYCSEKAFLPLHVKMNHEILEAWNELASKAPFGFPDSFCFSLIRQKIEWKWIPAISKWSAIENRWERLLSMVHDWVDSFCSFAPFDERWASINGEAETKKNILRTQECEPGKLQIRENIFKEYFNLEWKDIFTNETYLNQKNASMLWQSDELISLLDEVHSIMKPGNKPDTHLVSRAEDIYKRKAFKRQGMPTGDDLAPKPFAEWLQS